MSSLSFVHIVDEFPVVAFAIKKVVLRNKSLCTGHFINNFESILDFRLGNSGDIIVIDPFLNGQSLLSHLPTIKKNNPGSFLILYTADKKKISPDVSYKLVSAVVDKREPLAALEFAFCNCTGNRLINHHHSTSDFQNQLNKLTKRELIILELVCKGLSSTQIKGLLQCSEHTVRTHRKNIYKKLGVNQVMDLYLYCQELV
jgi:DNA-binding NarL/FixJ family response regulator